jgi:hypothetical protein
MLDGKDFRNWFDSGRFAETVARINRSPPQATIALMLAPAGTDSVEASVSAQAVHADHAALYLALFENDLYTPVKAGENTGAPLHHDFVVREWLGPYPVGDRGATTWRQTIALRPGWKTKDLGVVSFVQNRATGEVLQAVAATLCR